MLAYCSCLGKPGCLGDSMEPRWTWLDDLAERILKSDRIILERSGKSHWVRQLNQHDRHELSDLIKARK